MLLTASRSRKTNRPTSRIKKATSLITIEGTPWFGTVYTVGSRTDCDFSTITGAWNETYSNGIPALILVYPGTYDISANTFPYGFTRGLGVTPGDTIIRTVGGGYQNWIQIPGFGCLPSRMIMFENIYFAGVANSWWWAELNISSEQYLKFNKVGISVAGTTTDTPFVQRSPYSQTCYLNLRYCYVEKGYSHLDGFYLPMVFLDKTEFNGSLSMYGGSSGSFVLADYVISPTIGYGINYGNYLIQGVEDY